VVYLDDDDNELVKQMLLTQFLFNAQTEEPYTIDSSNLKFKTGLMDRMSEYTFSLKRAYTAINTIY